MKKMRLAIIGLGRLGRKCVEAISADQTTALAGIVQRTDESPDPGVDVPVVTHISELKNVDAALICVPPDAVLGVAQGLLQSRIPIVECARLHGEPFFRNKSEIHRVALHHKVPAIVGAGCDPGVLSLFRGYFAMLAPHGHTETTLHAGASLHHSLAAEGIKGVRKALATELKPIGGIVQRYVYVELEASADAAEVERIIVNDPLFLDEQTLVFPVPSIDTLEETNRGVVLERHGKPGEAGHASFLLEARFDETGLAARMMLVAAQSLATLHAGAYSLSDLPLSALWGQPGAVEEKEWM
ncbi:saccharopine dehydrogenase family protein [Methylobacter luteus]|uniref:diaminopimelate dehydrogenase n=1 Tax=Methylobacter luteus TaxID=415 RepID=UPI000410B0ED|nr:diaminopimelate dehydrogenase [Methylobacter luteus]